MISKFTSRVIASWDGWLWYHWLIAYRLWDQIYNEEIPLFGF